MPADDDPSVVVGVLLEVTCERVTSLMPASLSVVRLLFKVELVVVLLRLLVLPLSSVLRDGAS